MRPLRVFVCEDEEVSLEINRVILEDYLKRNQIKAEWEKIGLNINPLCLIQ